jgi:hypothetical protein
VPSSFCLTKQTIPLTGEGIAASRAVGSIKLFTPAFALTTESNVTTASNVWSATKVESQETKIALGIFSRMVKGEEVSDKERQLRESKETPAQKEEREYHLSKL